MSTRPSSKRKSRVPVVAGWLSSGMALDTAISKAGSEWKLKPDAADALVREALQMLRDRYFALDRHQVMARVLATLETAAERSMEAGQYGTTVQALNLYTNITGIGVQTNRGK